MYSEAFDLDVLCTEVAFEWFINGEWMETFKYAHGEAEKKIPFVTELETEIKTKGLRRLKLHYNYSKYPQFHIFSVFCHLIGFRARPRHSQSVLEWRCNA